MIPVPVTRVVGESKAGHVRVELVKDYEYRWKHKGKYMLLVVPEGFRFDGASVPRALWSVIGISPRGLVEPAACCHDWLYHNNGYVTTVVNGEFIYNRWTRKEADKLFARIMRELGMNKFRRRAAYYAVRVFGKKYWEDDAETNLEVD